MSRGERTSSPLSSDRAEGSRTRFDGARVTREQPAAGARPTTAAGAYPALPLAQDAALETVASVVVDRLDAARTRWEDPQKRSELVSSPLLIQVDGPGYQTLVAKVASRLRGRETIEVQGSAANSHPAVRDAGASPVAPSDGDLSPTESPHHGLAGGVPRQPWIVVRFDAWQYQRVSPPWWWLVRAIDQQLRESFHAAGIAGRKRLGDYVWRGAQFVKDFVFIAPVIGIALVFWYISGQHPMDQFLKLAAGVIGALTTIGAFLWSANNVVRRFFVASPVNVGTTTRTSDPMKDLQRRYAFLLRSAGTAVALIVENLDRCCADYTVELLEGFQTLLKGSAERDQRHFVAVLVPAERAWLCESYLQMYKGFQDATRQPGRPFGMAFLDKVFDIVLRLPRVPPVHCYSEAEFCSDIWRIDHAGSEEEIRRLVADAEDARCTEGNVWEPIPILRVHAVKRMGSLETRECDHLCSDTSRCLADLVNIVQPGATTTRQLRTGYCVQRTIQFLGGHEIEKGHAAIYKLGLWTILSLRWPLLAEHLARHPEHLQDLKRQRPPDEIGDELTEVFPDPEAAALTVACADAVVTCKDVIRFTSPRCEHNADRHPVKSISSVAPSGARRARHSS